MSERRPRLSVIVLNYNGSRWLDRCVGSLREQTVISECEVIIADNLSTHKTQAVRTFLAEHPRVRIHFTPTYSSWLNQVELWFAKIERDLLARGIFTSVQDLARRIRKYIRHYNKAPKPIRWSYRDPAHRIGSTSVNTGH